MEEFEVNCARCLAARPVCRGRNRKSVCYVPWKSSPPADTPTSAAARAQVCCVARAAAYADELAFLRAHGRLLSAAARAVLAVRGAVPLRFVGGHDKTTSSEPKGTRGRRIAAAARRI
eukprot:scaffold269_cov404-Prasinococcus_capsulatus_cf.AAC.21